MHGITHATSGAVAGLWLAASAPQLLATPHPIDQLVFATACAGYALLPDLDHPTSTATRRFGPASMLASAVVRPTSAVVFRTTALAKDRRGRAGTHRYLTHTLVAALLLGWAANTAIATWGERAVWVILFVALALAVKGIDHLLPGPPSLLAAAVLTGWAMLAGGAAAMAPWLGHAVTLGIVVHCLGDALTESGCPMLWPLPINGRTWHPVRPPALLRFRTGGVVEGGVLAVATMAVLWLVVDIVPGWSAARHDVLQWMSLNPIQP